MAPRPEKIQLSLWERIGMLRVTVSLVRALTVSFLTGIFVRNRPKSYFRHVMYSGMRAATSSFTSSNQEQASYVDTTKTYREWCKVKKVAARSITLPDAVGGKAHWLGPEAAECTMLYFHGGGFNATGRAEFFDFLQNAIEDVDRGSDVGGKRLNVLFLAYDTAPYATYPSQIAQAVALLNHTVQELRMAPSKVILAGDSAGANLALAVMSHVLHPHPAEGVPRLSSSFQNQNEKLKAAILISPWVDFGHSAPSFARNAGTDCVSKALLDRWGSAYLAGEAADAYSQPLRHAPQGWFKELDKVLDRLYVVCGGAEIMFDDIVAMTNRLQGETRAPLELEICEGEAHDVSILDRFIGYGPDDIEMDGVVRKWLKGILNG